MDMTLVVMAAGLGSRYGGVKQIERLGPDGEILMEYAIYDALRAGFDRIVLIIKPQMLQDVRALFGDRIEQRTGIRIDYAFQTPERFTAARPELAQRKKPLGTVHAVLCARDAIETPFAVINADDFYGRGAIDAIAAALPELRGAQDAAMVGYRLKNTVSPFGTVTRGVCATENGLLRKVHETYKIQLCPDGTIRDTSGEGAGVALALCAQGGSVGFGHEDPSRNGLQYRNFSHPARELCGDKKKYLTPARNARILLVL